MKHQREDTAAERERELERCRSDLWYLATDYLNYAWDPTAGGEDSPFKGKGLTERLHKHICRWIDLHRQDLFTGLWIPRWHHKTTLVIAQIIQDFLRDPNIALFYFHNVELQAEGVVDEVAWHMFNNDKLRSLDPVTEDKNGLPFNIFPPKAHRKRYHSKGKLTIRRPRYNRFVSLYGAGSNSEITGLHANKAYLDDPITAKAVDEGQLPKIQSWVQHTVLPVVDDTILRVSGTMWADWGLYTEWQKDPDWWTILLPGCPTGDIGKIDWMKRKISLVPDYTLQNPIYGEDGSRFKDKFELLARHMGPEFGPQMMNDPTPPAEMPWSKADCEHFVEFGEIARLPGVVIVLSDPAPSKVGEPRSREKNEWAVAAVKVVLRGQRHEIVLLDGQSSTEWSFDRGLDISCQFILQYPGALSFIEAPGSWKPVMEEGIRRASRRNGVRLRYIEPKSVGGVAASGMKNARFARLAELAHLGEFTISKRCNKTFLDKFLDQARRWKPLPDGKNSLRIDDCADVVSMATLPEVISRTPKMVVKRPSLLDDIFHKRPKSTLTRGTRYVRY